MFQEMLSLCTYNCRHYTNQKVPCIQSLFAKCDFVQLQAHCLYKSNLQKLYNINQKKIGYERYG